MILALAIYCALATAAVVGCWRRIAILQDVNKGLEARLRAERFTAGVRP